MAKIHENRYILKDQCPVGGDVPIAMDGNKWLQNFVPYVVYRINNQMTQRLRGRLRKSGVNISRWRVLSVLRANGEMSLGRIVDLTAMDQPSISRVVAHLESDGLVRRKTSKKDSRFVHVSLTAAGNAAFAEIYPTAQKHQERALSGFSNNEIETLKEYLHRIQLNIEAEE